MLYLDLVERNSGLKHSFVSFVCESVVALFQEELGPHGLALGPSFGEESKQAAQESQ